MSADQLDFDLDDSGAPRPSRPHWPTKAAARGGRPAEIGTCRFCGLELTRGGDQMFVAVERTEAPVSVAGIRCNAGECLNGAGQVATHPKRRASTDLA